MGRSGRPLAAPLAALLLIAAAPAGAQQQPAKPQTTSLDSEAPEGAPPHWLPAERWVMQHWLPYDEERLHRLLGVDREAVARQLRDDTHTIAELAEARGWAPPALAAALVAPWHGRLRDPARLAELERRALRTLTQGHLAQHIFFHSLHQDAVPDAAPEIFGVASREEFAALRRSEMSPLQICRLSGLGRGHAQQRATAVLRATAREGVRRQAIPEVQAERLLARQLRQLPRWLQQTRYNGPPPLVVPRASPATASNYSNNAVVSGDGRRVVYEAYEAKLAVAKRRGEIAVMMRGTGRAPPVLASADGALPQSSYNPALSADGRWVAFESAAGNLNFAKRYGQMKVFVRRLAGGGLLPVSHPPKLSLNRSAYNPTISGDGRLIAYEVYDDPERPEGATDVAIHDRKTGRTSIVPHVEGVASDLYEPMISADGRRLAFTVLARDASGDHSRVFVRDLAAGRTTPVSAPGEEAWEPVLSRDGSVVAYTAGGRDGASRVVVHDLRSARRTVIGSPAGSGPAFEPALSANGRRVAFTARPGGVKRTQVFVRDVRRAASELVSRADGRGGVAGLGTASHPSISADGRRVGFTSDAWNLAPEKCNSARGVFLRDVRRGRTRLMSVGDGANRYLGPTRGSSTRQDAFTMFLCSGGLAH